MKNEKLKKLLKSWDKSLKPKFGKENILKKEVLRKIRSAKKKTC